MKKLTYIVLFMAMFNLTNCKSNKIILISKGQGGDRNGSILLQNYFQAHKIDAVLLDNYNNLNLRDKGTSYLLIGQGATVDFMKNNLNITNNDKIFFYSHILSPDMISFLKKNSTSTMITTLSEMEINQKLENITSIPLAIPTYLESVAEKEYSKFEKDVQDVLSKDVIIHLGGSYKDSNNNDIIITNEQFQNAMKKINLNDNQSISIIVHPRTFKDILSDVKKIKQRLLSIQSAINNKNVHFFVSNDLYEIISKKDNKKIFLNYNIKLSPSYAAILYAINKLQFTKNHFVSVDQYNVFTDINYKINGFLLNPDDINQKQYLLKYNLLSSNTDVLNSFLNILEKK